MFCNTGTIFFHGNLLEVSEKVSKFKYFKGNFEHTSYIVITHCKMSFTVVYTYRCTRVLLVQTSKLGVQIFYKEKYRNSNFHTHQETKKQHVRCSLYLLLCLFTLNFAYTMHCNTIHQKLELSSALFNSAMTRKSHHY